MERGTDVVAAVVETHGRTKTAELLDGHREHPAAATSTTAARSLPELDVRAVLRARPRWSWSTSWRTPTPRAARTRSAGRTSKSCSTPGITVISTVNVQHLESLNDVVAADHRHRAAGDGARRGGPRRRPGRARRYHPGGAAAQAFSRQRLRRRQGRRRAVATTSAGEPHRAAGIGAAVAGRPGRRRAGQVPRGQQDHRHLGGPRTRRRGGHRRRRIGDVGAPRPSRIASKVQRRADGRARGARRRAGRGVRAGDGRRSRELATSLDASAAHRRR